MTISMDTEAGNKAFRDGTLRKTMQWAKEQLRPEAAFFAPTNGVRTAYFLFDLPDPSRIPVVAEPFFQKLGAKIELTPAMDFDDVQAGMEEATKNLA
jgi:hypothetical protein